MAELDVRPKVVDVAGYAGDTLTLKITVTGMDLTTALWEAQVRLTADAAVTAAVFAITPPTAADGPAYITLDAATTRLLGESGVTRKISGRSIQRFSGVWDCQVSSAGIDPVRTLVQGALTIDLDVTKVDA